MGKRVTMVVDWLGAGARLWRWAPSVCALCGQSCRRTPARCCDACRVGLTARHDTGRSVRLDHGAVPACFAFRYAGPLADWLVEAKFGRAPPSPGEILTPWATASSNAAATASIDAWVAIPPQLDRLRSRGWHVPDLLAGRLGKASGHPVERLLVRTDRGAPRSRDHGVLPHFAAAGRRDGRRVALVDDVVTRGETMRLAAAALTRAGHEVVLLAALADAGRGDDSCRSAEPA
ncbi:MAG: hypothetical protein H6747_13220 [Deltaproteobacteria bacterium]|nr:hypothetical protein [Deltaproteobacteria bacterium]